MKIIKAVLHFLRRWFLHLFEGRTLKDKRQRYQFGHVATLPGMNVLTPDRELPYDELPSLDWLIKVAEVFFLKIRGEDLTATAHDHPINKMKSAADQAAGVVVLQDALTDHIEERTQALTSMHWPTDLEGYNKLFSDHKIELPEIAQSFQPRRDNEGWFDDALFANLRTAGFNPMVIAGVSAIPEAFTDLTDKMYRTAVGAGYENDTLAAAASDGRLFACDYSRMAELIVAPPSTGGSYPDHVQKHLYAPQALFAIPPTATEDSPADLTPVAIRLSGDGAILYPNDPADTGDGSAWTQAKYAVNSADGQYHELVSHLGWTHLVIEPFAICTQRNLSENHELYRLLTPHFEGTMFINNAAAAKLIADGGQINQLLGTEIDRAQAFAVHARGINGSGFFKFNEQFVPTELKNRQVDSKCLAFAYRDDALRVWEAINGWVEAYIDVYYMRDIDVQRDVELQNWATELIAADGGQIQSFGDPEHGPKTINTKAYLVDALTMVIFTASAQHAAVNFAQADLMVYPPAVPQALYSDGPAAVPTTASTYSPDGQTQGMLQPVQIAELQIDLMTLLGGVYYTQLGDYGSDHFKKAAVKQALGQFQNNLRGVGQQIETANKGRTLKYRYLIPNKIPQSINI